MPDVLKGTRSCAVTLGLLGFFAGCSPAGEVGGAPGEDENGSAEGNGGSDSSDRGLGGGASAAGSAGARPLGAGGNSGAGENTTVSGGSSGRGGAGGGRNRDASTSGQSGIGDQPDSGRPVKSGDSGVDQASSGGGPTAITGLKIESNPKNVLSAFVSWTTDRPGDSVVQFGQGKYEWEISDAALVTSHRVLIIGMYASKAYQIKAMSATGDTPVSATGSFTTGALPSQIPVGKVPINDKTASQSGWTLVNVNKGNGTGSPISDYPAAAVMYDATGQPVWYYIDGKTNDFGGAVATYLTDKGVLIGPVAGSGGTRPGTGSSSGSGESPREVDLAGNTVWECKDPLCGGTGQLSHDTIKLSNGNHIVCRWVTSSGTGSTMGGGDQAPVFEEIDSSGKVVWSLDYAKLVPKPTGGSGDWCHGNSITVDIANDVVYANCRWMGLIKTTYKNPNSLVWWMAAKQGKGTGTIAFSSTADQFTDVHDPEIHADGTIMFFDNGGYATSTMGTPGQTTPTEYHSRVVEYKVDEAKKTASLVWEFPGTFNVDSWYKKDWYTAFFGDADVLPNGNVLITAGANDADAESRVFEVTKADGKVVWELRVGPDVGVYRADRITPPLLKAITQ